MQILKPDWLEVLFDRRNKEYGAYELRKNYERRLRNAIALMIGICLVLVGSYAIAAHMNGAHVIKPIIDGEVILAEVHPDKPVETPPATVPKPHVADPQIATIRDVTTRIVKTDEVDPKDVPPANADVDNVKIGAATNLSGNADEGIVPSVSDGTGKGLLTAPVSHDEIDDGKPFMRVENESYYPGGTKAWQRFLIKTFRTPEEAINQGVGGTVIVQFVVDKEGNVSDVHA
ncbi:MAG TPA: hypothetical protein VNU72_09530, partial [Puia sp.]|nr:hypothetical protein [Puia sp.]